MMRFERIRSINIENLQHGIKHLDNYLKTHSNVLWERDFHNSLYERLEHQRSRGLDEAFWQFLVDELAKWKAFRPTPREIIIERGLERLERLRTHYAPLSTVSVQLDHGLSQVSWRDVFPLFRVAAEIKPVKHGSPVFPSKLCHFLCPSIYPVFDNTLVKTGKIEYMEYWTECKKKWEKAPGKGALIQELKSHFPEAACDHYPWPTRIFEICQY